MIKWFNKQSRLLQILLLVIPGLNYFVELILRWEQFLKKKDFLTLIIAILSTVTLGVLLGYVDCIVLILTGKLFLAD